MILVVSVHGEGKIYVYVLVPIFVVLKNILLRFVITNTIHIYVFIHISPWFVNSRLFWNLLWRRLVLNVANCTLHTKLLTVVILRCNISPSCYFMLLLKVTIAIVRRVSFLLFVGFFIVSVHICEVIKYVTTYDKYLFPGWIGDKWSHLTYVGR